jgi:16S rRNA (adenine1518-N6/adenine1519-N6)-dimethyltransferase
VWINGLEMGIIGLSNSSLYFLLRVKFMYMRSRQNRLLNPSYLQSLLQKANSKPRREAGQNFILCTEVIEATLLAMRDGPKKVTELGAGIGALTLAMLEAGYEVRAIERDRTLLDILTREVGVKYQDRLEPINDDLRKSRWQWPEEQDDKDLSYQLVGNIPYNLSGFIIRRIVQLDPAPDRVLLLLQREVGERLIAKPPNMHLISLAVGLWGRVDLLLRVPASCFWPAPKVESCLVMMTPKVTKRLNVAEREKIINTARIFFQTKRKQMAGILKKQLEMGSLDDAIALLTKVNIDGKSRPQEVTLEQWRALSHML